MADFNGEDARTALDILEHSPSVALRICGERGGFKTLFITENISLYGYSRQEFLSAAIGWNHLVHADDLQRLIQQLDENTAKGLDKYVLCYRVKCKNGTDVWVADHRTVIRGTDGGVRYTNCVITDCSELKDSQAGAAAGLAQHQVLNEILQLSYTGDLDETFKAILDRTGRFLAVSRVILFEDNFDHSLCTAVHEWTAPNVSAITAGKSYVVDYKRDLPEVSFILNGSGAHIVNFGEIPARSRIVFEREGVVASAIFAVYRGSERYGFICFDECVHPRRWDAGTVAFLRNVSRLVSAALLRRHTMESIRHMAYHDRLTGLANRHRFDGLLDDAVLRAKKAQKQGYVLFFDMDDFKIINEGYGHEYGDALLTTVADYLAGSYGQRARLFRFGGDEFAMLIDPEHSGDIQEILDALLARARQPWQVMDRKFYCTVSVGVVRFPDGGGSPAEVSRNADIALHRAKNAGKDNYVLYNGSMDNESALRVNTEHQLREAIENEFSGFRVHYQPIVDLTGAVIGAEALIRWADASSNLIQPGKFIPLAEYLGLIVPLGEFVLRESALFCAAINGYLPDFKVNVNVSIRQFQQHDFLGRVEKALKAAGTNFNNIVLEVTEGMVVQDMAHMQMMAEQLRGMGLKVAMDDFGTGYSSLNNMRTLPLDIIKIDRSFIRDVTNDAYAKSFIRLITDLVHSMGRTVCVEGVETAAQYCYCTECEIDSIQGFYFHKPMPAAQLRRLLLNETGEPG